MVNRLAVTTMVPTKE